MCLYMAIYITLYNNNLLTCHNQFGFKHAHSTDLCTFELKQVIDYYSRKSSPVYICYLDASKAFDSLNSWGLFDKLLNRGLPVISVRLLVYWYTKQQFLIWWVLVSLKSSVHPKVSVSVESFHHICSMFTWTV